MTERRSNWKGDKKIALSEIKGLLGKIGRLTADQLLHVMWLTGPERIRNKPDDASLFFTALDTGLSIGLRHPRLAQAMMAAMRSSVADGEADRLAEVNGNWNAEDEEWAELLTTIFGVEEQSS